jgi:predicted transcriptional regulator
MSAEKKSSGAALGSDLSAPNAGELDVLAVLWREQAAGDQPLQLSEVHRRVCERRRSFHEAEPATTTVSTQLRNLVAKGLIRETTVGRPAGEAPSQDRPILTRSGMKPTTRSPLTSYQALSPPGEVLRGMFTGLAEAYPPEVWYRLTALLDFAGVLGLPDELLHRLVAFVEKEKGACPSSASEVGKELRPETKTGDRS